MPKASKVGTEARNVKPDVRQAVLHESGYKCGNPNCHTLLTIELHHLTYVSDGGDDLAHNPLPLCPTCHARHHVTKEIPTESLRAWKMLLLALNEAFDRRAIETLLVLAELDRIEWITGDGIPTYAPLVASGMATVKQETHWTHTMGRQTFQDLYKVRITDKGKAFIEGWKRGDQRAALGLLPTTHEA